MKVVLLGATRGMGRAVARRLAARGAEVFLLGRDPEALSRSARDLEVRGAAAVGTAECDLLDERTFEPALRKADETLRGFDTVILTAGIFASQETLERDVGARVRLLTANFSGSVGFCEEARKLLLARGGGTLCAFSSVAGDRGRKPVVLYGAAKAGLSHYLEGLDHRYRLAGLRTVCIKPGFVKTAMTAGLRPPPFAGDPDTVADGVIRAIDRGKPVAYVPPIWRWVMVVIRLLPRRIMRRIEF